MFLHDEHDIERLMRYLFVELLKAAQKNKTLKQSKKEFLQPGYFSYHLIRKITQELHNLYNKV